MQKEIKWNLGKNDELSILEESIYNMKNLLVSSFSRKTSFSFEIHQK
jgi:hypothetical protein